MADKNSENVTIWTTWNNEKVHSKEAILLRSKIGKVERWYGKSSFEYRKCRVQNAKKEINVKVWNCHA